LLGPDAPGLEGLVASLAVAADGTAMVICHVGLEEECEIFAIYEWMKVNPGIDAAHAEEFAISLGAV